MKAEVIEDAKILIPNREHRNFTESSDIIAKGTIVEGEPKMVKGKRKGEDFTYKLFSTNKQLIFINKIKPMRTTEVTLGADAQQSPTVVKVPEGKKLFTKNVIIYTLLGAGVGFGISKYKKFENKKTVVISVIGALIGLGVGKYIEKRKAVTIKPSK